MNNAAKKQPVSKDTPIPTPLRPFAASTSSSRETWTMIQLYRRAHPYPRSAIQSRCEVRSAVFDELRFIFTLIDGLDLSLEDVLDMDPASRDEQTWRELREVGDDDVVFAICASLNKLSVLCHDLYETRVSDVMTVTEVRAEVARLNTYRQMGY